MKRAASLKLKFVAVFTTIFTALNLQPANAAQFATTLATSCSSTTSATSAWSVATPFNVPESATVTRIEWQQASGTPTDAYIQIRTDNSGAPTGSSLGTFTYSSMNGFIASFVGSATLSTAGRYWVVFRQVTTLSLCYSTSPVYTGSPSGWTMGTTYTWSSTNSGVTYTSRNDYMAFLFALYGSGGGVQPPASSISLSGNQTASFRQAVTITATLGVAGTNGKVTFFANSKRIPGCIGKQSNALSATCSWRPSQRGAVTITAALTPTDTGYASSTSAPKTILIGTRTNTR